MVVSASMVELLFTGCFALGLCIRSLRRGRTRKVFLHLAVSFLSFDTFLVIVGLMQNLAFYYGLRRLSLESNQDIDSVNTWIADMPNIVHFILLAAALISFITWGVLEFVAWRKRRHCAKTKTGKPLQFIKGGKVLPLEDEFAKTARLAAEGECYERGVPSGMSW